jgi:hypothetical protein
MVASTEIVWTKVQPHLKWKVLAKQKRFLMWALYSSIGSMMLGRYSILDREDLSNSHRFRFRRRRDLHSFSRIPKTIWRSISFAGIWLPHSRSLAIRLGGSLLRWQHCRRDLSQLHARYYRAKTYNRGWVTFHSYRDWYADC